MADYQFIQYETKDRLAYITINRPNAMNSVNPALSQELYDAFNDFNQDADRWVAIITGAGDRAFSTGMDLKAAAESNGVRDHERTPGGFGGITNPRFQIWKPLICAINGFALGGGLEIALSCDILIAAETAQLGLPEPKVGLAPGAGGVYRLPRLIPQKIALGYMLTGRFMSAQEALRWGLVNEVVPAADLMDAAERWAEQILECAPLAVRGVKQGTMQGLDLPLEAAYNNRFFWMDAALDAEDYREGITAFTEKRKPQWKGR